MWFQKSKLIKKAEEAKEVLDVLGLNKSAKNDVVRYLAAEILGEQYESVEKMGRLHMMSKTDKETLIMAIEDLRKEGITLGKESKR